MIYYPRRRYSPRHMYYPRVFMFYPRTNYYPRVNYYPRKAASKTNAYLDIKVRKGHHLYDLKKVPEAQHQELYDNFRELKERLVFQARILHVRCAFAANELVPLEDCLCRCKERCHRSHFSNLVKETEVPKDYMDDFLRFRRLANAIYGTTEIKERLRDED